MANGGTVIIKGGSLTIESNVRFDRRERNGKHTYYHPETDKKITRVEIEGSSKSGSLAFMPVNGKCTIRIHYKNRAGKKAGRKKGGVKKTGRK